MSSLENLITRVKRRAWQKKWTDDGKLLEEVVDVLEGLQKGTTPTCCNHNCNQGRDCPNRKR